MKENQWVLAWKLFQAASDLPPDGSRAFIESHTSDPEIIEQVVAMLNGEPALEDAGVRMSGPSDLTGQMVGRYKITGRLGHGGMGVVYSAEDTELDRVVALKFLNQEVVGQRVSVDRFIHEAKAASALNHPNIVTVHEVIRAESGLAIAMELVDGVPLRSRCECPVPVDELIHLGRQITEALAVAHTAGIVHRDIKPENIMMRRDGYIKVLDFGLARRFGEKSAGNAAALGGVPGPNTGLGPSLAFGTVRYMSPEQYRGERLSGASDVYSLGIVLYEMATAKHPFAPERTPGSVGIADGVPAPPSSLNPKIPGELERLILVMLAGDPQARPTAREVCLTLDKITRPSDAQLKRTGRLAPAVLAAAFLTVSGVLGWIVFHKESSAELTGFRIHSLTSQVGWEGNPALSSDGQSVAFTWTEKADQPRQIYVKRFDAEAPVRVATSDAAGSIGPLAWSPDGKRIAFKRQHRRRGAIYSISKEGGDEKKLVDLVTADLSSGIDWSPDGSQLTFSDALTDADHLSIYLFNLQTGEKRKLTSTASEEWGDWDPKFSPDGQSIAFKRVSGFLFDDIYIVPTAGGPIRRLTKDRRGIWGHAWTSDGRSVIVSSQQGGSLFGLWQFPLVPNARPRRIAEGGLDAVLPATARTTNRFVWVNQLEDFNIYRLSTTPASSPAKLIGSGARDLSPGYSPDGRIAFFSDRSGNTEIWLASADGSSQVRVTNLNGPHMSYLSWSPDGRHLAFDSGTFGSTDVFLLDCTPGSMHCGEPTQVTSESSSELLPSWSHDGKVLYFASNRTSAWEVWKQSLTGGSPVQMTRHGGHSSHESPDGEWLYFAKYPENSIWRIPGSKSIGTQSGIVEELVFDPQHKLVSREWAVARDEIVFIERSGNSRSGVLRAFNVPTKKIRTVFTFAEFGMEARETALAVSPDSRWILYSQLDRSGSNIMVADKAD